LARAGAAHKAGDEIGSVDHNLKDALARLDALAKFTEEGALFERSIKLSDAARAEFEQLRQFVHDQTQLLEGRDREWMSKVSARLCT
jgi:5-carboxymethyl-2-hydroxymuconate isomerase